MELKTLGYSEVKAGQLLTFYIGDEEGEKRFEYILLYALKDFNLSEVMAHYYPNMIQNIPSLKSEIVLTDFTECLIEEGYVTRPDNTLIKLGNKGRPPERIMQEYKFKLNPRAFTFERLKEEIKLKSIFFFNHQGNTIHLLSDAGLNDEIRLELSRDEEYLGVLEIGMVSSDKKPTIFNQADFEKIKGAVTQLIDKAHPGEGIRVERVMFDLPYNTRFRIAHEPRSLAHA